MRSGKLVGVVALGLGIGLFGVIGVRVKDTLADRKVLAARLDEKSKGGAARAAVTVWAVRRALHRRTVTQRLKDCDR